MLLGQRWGLEICLTLTGHIKGMQRAMNIVLHKRAVSACARLSCMGRIRVEHAINEGARIQVAKHNETVKQNRAFLNRLVDVTSLLVRRELSFRGHDETSESSNKGNYREFTETLAKHDSVLSTQFESSTVFSGMSHNIQNDLISALAATVSDQIRDEIQDAPYFGW